MSAALKSPDMSLDAAFVLACLRRYREHVDHPQRVNSADTLDDVLIGDGMTGDALVAWSLRDPIRTALRATVRNVGWRVLATDGPAALRGMIRGVVAAMAEGERDWAERTLTHWLRGVGERP